jgi:hypothetical protein
VSRKKVEVEPSFADSLSDVERRLVQLYYCEDESPQRIEFELKMPYEEAMRLLGKIGEVEYQIEWRHEGPVTMVRRKRRPQDPS